MKVIDALIYIFEKEFEAIKNVSFLGRKRKIYLDDLQDKKFLRIGYGPDNTSYFDESDDLDAALEANFGFDDQDAASEANLGFDDQDFQLVAS